MEYRYEMIRTYDDNFVETERGDNMRDILIACAVCWADPGVVEIQVHDIMKDEWPIQLVRG